MWRRVRTPPPYPSESYETMKREQSAQGYNRATLPLGGYKYRDLNHKVDGVSDETVNSD
jgi:hypothetical protein